MNKLTTTQVYKFGTINEVPGVGSTKILLMMFVCSSIALVVFTITYYNSIDKELKYSRKTLTWGTIVDNNYESCSWWFLLFISSFYFEKKPQAVPTINEYSVGQIT